VVAAQGAIARWGFADSVRDCCSFGSERVVSEPELCPGLADGAFGVAEVGVGSRAVRGGSERAELMVGGDVVAVSVGLDGSNPAFPCRAGGVVFGSGAEDRGDVVRWVYLGGDDELAFGSAFASQELLFECAEVADVVGVAVDPGDGVVVGALVFDFLNSAGVEPVDVGVLGSEAL
jgi:hypothetical protein